MTTRPPFRPPSVPLIVHHPYFSIWSPHDRLTEGDTRHWTGRAHALVGLVRIDGRPWRFCGAPTGDVPEMEQRSCVVTVTSTSYVFEADGVRLRATFLSPLLCDDLEVLSRPVTYLTWSAQALDGREHQVAVQIEASGEIAVDHWTQPVVWARFALGDLQAVRIGAAEQRPLHRSGDDVRIDWGWLYLAGDVSEGASLAMGHRDALRSAFIAGVDAPEDDLGMPRAACDRHPVLACRWELGAVAASPQERTLLIAYDDVASVEYLQRRLHAWWRDGGRVGFGTMLRSAARERRAITERCRELDERLAKACVACAGPALRELATLSYRQCLGAHVLVKDVDGTPYLLSKEAASNGCIATVDVTFPSAPLFLLLNAGLVRAMLEPVLRYAATPAWRFPFAPHDLGTYPLANGQVYGGAEESERDQMPIEESGNVLILAAAIAEAEGSAAFAEAHWTLLERWAAYVRDLGFDPPNQLCTDDFAGHLPGNCNLSVKAILGLGAFARLCERRGEAAEAREWRAVAEDMAARWRQLACDGGHSRLAFSLPGTWSQKYTLVWDRVLDLRLFAPEVAAAETRCYRERLNPYGLPLDHRHQYTTIDHVVWSACLAEDEEDLRSMLDACRAYVTATPDRVPLADWYDTVTARRVGFQARSVVGGLFMPLMRDLARWQPWIERQREMSPKRAATVQASASGDRRMASASIAGGTTDQRR